MQEDLYLRCKPAAPVVEDEDENNKKDLENILTASNSPYSLLSMAKLSQHVRYLDINQPSRLAALSQSRSRGFITLKFLPDMSDSMIAKFVYVQLPTIFARVGVHSSFLVNYWPSVMTLLIGIGLAFILWGASVIFKSAQTPSVISNLQTIFRWNFCFILIAINVDDIIMFGYIDLYSMQLKNSNATLSLFVILCMMFLALLTMLLAFVFAKKFQTVKKQAHGTKNFDLYEKFIINWQSWQVLYRGFTENTLLGQSFYIIYIIRLGLPMIITIAFLDKPVSQSVLHLIVSAFILSYILLRCPLKRKVNYAQLVIVETFMLVVHICCLILAIKDFQDSTSSKLRVWLGDIIILCNFGINITFVIFLVIKLMMEVSNIRTLQKVRPVKNNAPWVRLLAIFIEQGAFGFEEILEDTWFARQSVEHPEVDLLNPPPSESLYPPKADETQIHLQEENEPPMEKKEKFAPANPIFHFPHNEEFFSAYGSVEAKNHNLYSEKIRDIKKKYTNVKKPESEIELDDSSPGMKLQRGPSSPSRRRDFSPYDTLTSLHGKPVTSTFIEENNSPSTISLGGFGETQNSPLVKKRSAQDRLSLLKKRSNQKVAQEPQEEQFSPTMSPMRLGSDFANEHHSPASGSLIQDHDNSNITYKSRNLSRLSNRSPSRNKKQNSVYPDTFTLN